MYFDSESITLEQLHLADADKYFDLFDTNRDHFRVHDHRLSQGFTTIKSVEQQLSPYSSSIFYAVIRDGDFIGSTTLLTNRHQNPELTCWIDKNHVSKGLATIACRLTLAKGVADFDMQKFDALVAPTNTASLRLVQKLGFQHEHTLEEDELYTLDLAKPRSLPDFSLL